tara:strand:+ start:720 stop:3098 length:2379 start_codon:yes stop_codon:yes gene_type:complete
MPFLKISPNPGMFTDGTRYTAEGTWYDADKVRFRKGFAEKLGGWIKYINASFLGTCRKIHDWVTDGGSKYVGVGTHLKLYVNLGGGYYDVTPIRSTVDLGTNPIATVNNTAVITITTSSDHGAVAGDYVTIAGATASGGIGTGSINKEHRIVALGAPDGTNTATKFRVVCDSAASSTDTAAGGGSVTAAFQINTGLDTFVDGGGWGSGTWGSSTWGSATSIGQATQLRVWSLDNFGDDMLACVRQGKIFYWDESNGVSTRAIPLEEVARRSVTLLSDPISVTNTSSVITVTDKGGHGAVTGDKVTLSGATAVGGVDAASINKEHTIASTPTKTTFTVDTGDAASSTTTGGGSAVSATYKAGTYYPPVGAYQVLMSDVGRHVVALGCTGVNSTTINPLNVRWSSSETVGTWQPLSTNSAGGQELSSGSEIIGGLPVRQEILIWTDAGVTSMRYVGSPFYFSFTEVARGMSMISQNAAVNANGRVFFMDRGDFYVYAGSVQKLKCPILTTVFGDFDLGQRQKVACGHNPDFSEVTWFYPSESGSGENDRYVTHNYEDDVWYAGTLVRGGWSQANTKSYPLASSIIAKSLTEDPFTTNTSSTSNVSINSAGHGLSVGDTVFISGASAVGGLSATLLNNQHTVVTVTDTDNYTITIADTATADTGGGGAVVVNYENVLYSHENGYDDDGSAMTAYIETADMDLEEGDKTWSIHRIIPDFYFTGAESGDEVTISLNGHNFPADSQTSIASVAFTPSTAEGFVRARARQVSMKVQSTGLGYGWRLGFVRLDGRADSRR